MKRDFKHLGSLDSRRGKSLSIWLWLIGGISIGLFVAFLNYLHGQTPTIEQPLVSFDKPIANPAPPPKGRTVDSAAIGADMPAQPPNNDFDFYTVLPKMEMPVPEAPVTPKHVAPKVTEDLTQTVADASEPAPVEKKKDKPQEQPRKNQDKPKEKEVKPVKIEKAPKVEKSAPPSKPVTIAKVDRHKFDAYLLQVGSFRNLREADGMKARLALLGVEARIQTVKLNSRDTLHRVRVGPYADYDKVSRLQSRLKLSNIRTVVVKART